MMKYEGIIITGTSGSGKSTVVEELCKANLQLKPVQAITTREKRSDDVDGAYQYLDREAFNELKNSNELLISTTYRGKHFYGIKRAVVESIIRSGYMPILTLTPKSAYELDGLSRSENENPPRFLSVFLDAPDHELNSRLKNRDDSSGNDAKQNEQRAKDRKYQDNFIYKMANVILKSTVTLIEMLWNYSNIGGVLHARLIHLFLETGSLLENAKPENIQGASYDLSLGSEYFYGGRIRKLAEENPILLIEPYDYAIVTSEETANFPTDIAGRFDLSVSMFCQGIILSNGPQIDPGFRGPLFCLLFNTSSSPVLLKKGQHYATLEFHKLLEPTYAYRGAYQEKRLIDYLPSNAAQGAINELKKELDQVRSESRNMQTFALGILSLILALIALLIVLR